MVTGRVALLFKESKLGLNHNHNALQCCSIFMVVHFHSLHDEVVAILLSSIFSFDSI